MINMDDKINLNLDFTKLEESEMMKEANKVFKELGYNDYERYSYVNTGYRLGWHFNIATLFAKLGYDIEQIIDIIDLLLIFMCLF